MSNTTEATHVPLFIPKDDFDYIFYAFDWMDINYEITEMRNIMVYAMSSDRLEGLNPKEIGNIAHKINNVMDLIIKLAPHMKPKHKTV